MQYDTPDVRLDPAIEVWAGFECTIARVGDAYRNQCAETGHAARLADLELAASLGITRLRYPVLWEAIALGDPGKQDWSWCDTRLARLRELGVQPIAGLVHHGSGPRYTSLLDPQFPTLLADHATAVARRYPWLEDFTPVNEPLTTARFSALYGHWYPHARDEASFLRALFIQCQAVAAAMAAIRRITPHARLVQTEDLGRVFSTPHLAYQARYENERRWLSFDLLTGRVDRHHAWFAKFRASGIAERDLLALAGAPCPPQVVGINHYLTSDRFLDEDLTGYPADHIGGNGRDRYADVAAARAHIPAAELGFAPRLQEAWQRYRLPLAITEVHNGSTREEQLRWLVQACSAATVLRADGVDIRAITPWALVGAVDWTSLLTRNNGHYEPGVFDARATPPRPTVLAHTIRALTRTGTCAHPVAAAAGWWQRPDRFHRPAAGSPAASSHAARPILVTGRTGTLGQAFARICDQRGLAYRLLSRAQMDIADPTAIAAAIDEIKPWAIVNTAGFVRVGEAARQRARCMRDNATGPAVLAELAAHNAIPLMTFSSDLVFDGRAERPYVESDPINPACVYGLSKAVAERRVIAAHDGALVVRTSAFFGPWDRYNFAHAVLAAVRAGRAFAADSATVVSPTYVPDLVHNALDLLIDGESGIWHIANDGQLSWHEFARHVARAARLDEGLVCDTADTAKRFTVLRSEKGLRLRAVETAIDEYVSTLRAA